MMVMMMKRSSIIASLGFLMLMGIAVYFRLWAIDYNISSDDSELIRRQFDIANKEAMDESAEWRLRYDEAVDREKKCLQELQVLQESSKKLEDGTGIDDKLAILQKENANLLERLETLRLNLEAEKRKCTSRFMN